MQPALHAWLCANAKDVIYQIERAKSGLIHFQIYCALSEKKRPIELAKEFNEEFGGCDVSACSTKGLEALSSYCMKTESRVAGPWAKNEAKLKKLLDAQANEYKGQDLPRLDQFTPWQRALFDYATGPIDPRRILWICDQNGKTGKSTVAKFLAFHHDACVLSYGDASSLINVVTEKYEADKAASRCYIFNLTRSKPKLFSNEDIYSALESIKDGMVVNTKYRGRTIYFNTPHVIVLANRMPELEGLSKDRWLIRTLTEKHQVDKDHRGAGPEPAFGEEYQALASINSEPPGNQLADPEIQALADAAVEEAMRQFEEQEQELKALANMEKDPADLADAKVADVIEICDCDDGCNKCCDACMCCDAYVDDQPDPACDTCLGTGLIPFV